MDKVIDGVDVSECKNFGIYKDRITQEDYQFCNKSGKNCEEIKDCYYKQLQRARAEIEELKAECEKKDNIITDITKGAVKYRKALEDIRDIVDKNISFMDTASTTKAMIRIQAKINEVIGAE